MLTQTRRFPKPEPIELNGRTYLRASIPLSETAWSEQLAPETIAGRYRVDRLLAIGETTVLWQATDDRTRRPVVIKALRPDAVELPPAGLKLSPAERAGVVVENLRRLRHALQTERRLLVRLRNLGCATVAHPNDYVHDANPWLSRLDPAIDDALIDSEPYLVLERLNGPTLERLIAESYPAGVPEPLALAWIAPIADVLARLHEPWRTLRGRTWHCVYQDLKPANVVVEPSGRPRLFDFGGCQVVIDGVPVLAGSCTPGYAPPECLVPGPARVLLPNADVYGIGSTLHQMLTGRDPRERDRRPLSADDLPRSVSPPLRRFVARCLALKPSERFADAAEALRALQADRRLPRLTAADLPTTFASRPTAGVVEPRDGWAIGEERFRTRRHVFRQARKAFRDFKVPDRSFSISDQDEWLNALVRLPIAADEGEGEAAALDFELDRVFRKIDSPSIPRPIDVIRLENENRTLPGLVLAEPVGEPAGSATAGLAETFRELQTAFQGEGLELPGGFDPADFRLDPATGAPTFLGTDRLIDPAFPPPKP